MKYTFEYMFIPLMVENGDFAFPNYHDFDDIQSLEDAFEDSGLAGEEPFPWDELSIVKYISRECTYWLFRFPKPERQPEAVYAWWYSGHSMRRFIIHLRWEWKIAISFAKWMRGSVST